VNIFIARAEEMIASNAEGGALMKREIVVEPVVLFESFESDDALGQL
jgi:hypothetical protein